MVEKGQKLTERELQDGVIKQAAYCHLSCSLDDQPYLIPISYGYDGKFLYIHTALRGKKVDIFHLNPQVCLAFESQVTLNPDPDLACKWSFSYQSVILEGSISELTSPADKVYGLEQVMAHYSPSDWQFPPEMIRQTRIWKITPEHIYFKSSQ